MHNQCGYCLRVKDEEMPLCNLRSSPKEGWQDQEVRLCDACQKHLNGQFRKNGIGGEGSMFDFTNRD